LSLKGITILPPLLTIENLKTKIGGPFNLKIQSQQIAFLSGESGSGKTLFLRSIADLDEHEGFARFDNLDTNETPADIWRKNVGLLLADSSWWLPLISDHFNIEDPGAKEKIESWANAINLPLESFSRNVEHLSTGELNRWALIRLLCNSPKALLLDEPTANLDKKNSLAVESLLIEYIEINSVPTLWVTHDQLQIKRISGKPYRISKDSIEAVTS